MSNSKSPLIDRTTQPTFLRQYNGSIPINSRPSVPGIAASNVGMLFIISAQFTTACMYISVKLLNTLEPSVHTLEIITIRMVVTFICCVIYMIIMRIPNPIIGPKGVRTLLVIRGITGFFGLCGVYWSLVYLSVADATVLIFLTPLTTAVAGCILLKESYSTNQAVAAVCSLLGVIFIARPTFIFSSAPAIPDGHHLLKGTPVQRLVGVSACMISVLGNTGAYTSMRGIGKRAHPMHLMIHFSLWCTILALLGMCVLNVSIVYPTPWAWILLLMASIFGFATQTLLTMGLQRETVSRGITGMYAQLLFVVMLELLFFGVIPSSLSVLGAAIIMSSGLYVGLTKQDPTPDNTTDNTTV
ncbi:drug/metabolite transporter superfamily [Suillus paluster]|uniref:drug/metabolite transporter superfamily n=1 Tax=Suillus paluster TaxID=48578 RepID=UPI001B86F4F8|nr:drug/metabolite transporter superfamily [Suillus paluster]KAG1744999.1 drug/metabolite transporter superfamily [Suillus paluster]